MPYCIKHIPQGAITSAEGFTAGAVYTSINKHSVFNLDLGLPGKILDIDLKTVSQAMMEKEIAIVIKLGDSIHKSHDAIIRCCRA